MNVHATAMLAGDRGILFKGPSGSGKSTLALTLLGLGSGRGMHAALIGDDQVFVENRAGVLLAHAPESIAGLAEVFGLGPRKVPYRKVGRIDLLVRLGPPQAAPRLQEIAHAQVAGISLPVIDVPERQTIQSTLAIAAWLGWQPFA